MEIFIWHRETWWKNNRVISDLQGTCKKGLSCIHTAMLLQETVATSLETNRKCLVAYFDVAKAFNTVWIEGLFFQLFELGIHGKTWRILYNFYIIPTGILGAIILTPKRVAFLYTEIKDLKTYETQTNISSSSNMIKLPNLVIMITSELEQQIMIMT